MRAYRKWPVWIGALFGVFYLLTISTVAWGHDHYTKWKQQNGASCCNATDCKPAKVKWTPTGWKVFLNDQWCDVPPEKVRPYKSPDGGPHVCAPVWGTGCQIYCFVHGEIKG